MNDTSQRRHIRVSIPLLVQYRFEREGPATIDYALNISKSGIYVPTQAQKEPGTPVFVLLTTREGQLLEGSGKVVRAGDGLAIELSGFSAEAHGVLDRLVQETLAKDQEKKVGRKSGAFRLDDIRRKT